MVFFTAFTTARYQSFKKLGTFHQHVGYANMGVQIDIDPFYQYIASLKEALEDVRYSRMNGYGKATFSRLLSTVQEIESRLDEYGVFFRSHPHAVSRHRRQLAAFAGVGVGILALYDVESLKDTVGEMESRQNSLVRQVVGLSNDTLILAKNFKKLKGAIDMMKSMELRIAHLLKIESAIQQVSVFADKYFSGLSSLMDGKISIDLIKGAVAKEEFLHLKSAAFSAGFETVFSDFSQIYQLPASYLVKDGRISVVVDVPIVPTDDYKKFSLYKYDSIPFMLEEQLVKVSGDSNLIAVSVHKDEFVEISRDALHGCLHIGSTFLCHFLGVKITESYPCCLCDIFSANLNSVLRNCDLIFLSERFRMERVNATAFVFFSNETISGLMTCGRRQSQLSLSGFGIRNLDPGCVFTTSGATFVAATIPQVEVQQVVSVFPTNVSLLDDLGPINASLSAALSDFDKINFNALIKGGEELQDLAPLQPVSSRLWIVWVVVALFPLMILLCVGAVYYKRRELFDFAVRGLAEGERFHVDSRRQGSSTSSERSRVEEEASRVDDLVMQVSRLRKADAESSRTGESALVPSEDK